MPPFSAPIEAVQALVATPGASGAGVPSLQLADVAAQATERPTAQDAAAFARAVQVQDPVRSGSPIETRAMPPSSDSLTNRLAHQADALSRYVGGLQDQLGHAIPSANGSASADAAAEPRVIGPDGAHKGGVTDGAADMRGAVSQMERAYVFAIETTMASRGSTESTKIFNTLLKGQ